MCTVPMFALYSTHMFCMSLDTNACQFTQLCDRTQPTLIAESEYYGTHIENVDLLACLLLQVRQATRCRNDDPLHYDISSPVVLAECPSCGVFGSCLTNGTCLCSPGYSGPRCEMHCPSLVANTRDACIASTTLRTCSGCSCFAGTAWNATLRPCAPNTKLCNFSNKTGALLSNHSCSIMHHPNDGSGLAETISSPAMLGV